VFCQSARGSRYFLRDDVVPITPGNGALTTC
jgi:hypothetical protein